MIAGKSAPIFPHWLAAYPLSTPHLDAVVQRAVLFLKYTERFTHPRGPRLMRRPSALSASPWLFSVLSGVVPATVIGIIALAYLEDDGLLLSVGLLAAIIVLMVEFAAVWAILRGAKWIVGL